MTMARSRTWVGVAVRVVVLALVGCGAAPPVAQRTPFCGATCEGIDLRGPVAVSTGGTDGVLVATRDVEGHLRLGVAKLRRGRWLARSLRLRSALPSVGLLGLAAGGGHAFIAHSAGTSSGRTGLWLSRVRTPGGAPEVVEMATLDDQTPADLAVAHGGPDGVWCAWVRPDGSVRVAQIPEHGEPERTRLPLARALGARVAIAPMTGGVWLARASETGVEVLSPGASQAEPISDRPARELAMAASGEHTFVVWTDDLGVWAWSPGQSEPVSVDRGHRRGEPRHRIGAALTVVVDRGEALVAYQDQTVGAVVTARVGRMVTRQQHRSRAWTRGFWIALVNTREGLFLLDMAARGGPLRETLLTTRIR